MQQYAARIFIEALPFLPIYVGSKRTIKRKKKT